MSILCRLHLHRYEPIVTVAVMKPPAVPGWALHSIRTLDAYLAERDATTQLQVQILGMQCVRCGKRK